MKNINFKRASRLAVQIGVCSCVLLLGGCAALEPSHLYLETRPGGATCTVWYGEEVWVADVEPPVYIKLPEDEYETHNLSNFSIDCEKEDYEGKVEKYIKVI